MAPELFDGSAERIDLFRVDSWALGIILVAMAAGRFPWCAVDTRGVRWGGL
jgi:hypothetical protein